MKIKTVISCSVAACIALLAFAAPAKAEVKVLQYNADGTIKGISSSKKNKSKKNAGSASGSAQSKSKGNTPADRYVEGELLVVNPSRHFEVNVKPLGFSVVAKKKYSSLKLSVLRLRTPAKYSVSEAKAYLSSKFPRLNVDANHTYDITGTALDTPDEFIQMAALKSSPASCGRGVRIGMIDGGINLKHPTLAGQKIKYRRFSAKGTKPGPSAHGTAIAGMFVGKMAKQGLGGYLPAAEVRAASVQEVGPSRRIIAKASSILDAIDWLATEKVHVINFNIAGADNKALRTAVERANSKCLIMVAAVGNWKSTKIPAFPAAYASVIGVTSVDKKKKIYSRANRGQYVDFAAKGVRIWAAGTAKGGQFMSGTSYATPVISSLIAQKNAQGKKSSPEAIRKYLKGFATDIGSSGKDTTYGWGMIDRASLCK